MARGMVRHDRQAPGRYLALRDTRRGGETRDPEILARRDADTDPLTGLLNRRGWDGQAAAALARARSLTPRRLRADRVLLSGLRRG